MTVAETVLLDALKTVIDPNTGKDFVSTRQLKNLVIEGGSVAFDVELGYPANSQIDPLRKALIAAARTVAGVENVSATYDPNTGQTTAVSTNGNFNDNQKSMALSWAKNVTEAFGAAREV